MVQQAAQLKENLSPNRSTTPDVLNAAQSNTQRVPVSSPQNTNVPFDGQAVNTPVFREAANDPSFESRSHGGRLQAARKIASHTPIGGDVNRVVTYLEGEDERVAHLTHDKQIQSDIARIRAEAGARYAEDSISYQFAYKNTIDALIESIDKEILALKNRNYMLLNAAFVVAIAIDIVGGLSVAAVLTYPINIILSIFAFILFLIIFIVDHAIYDRAAVGRIGARLTAGATKRVLKSNFIVTRVGAVTVSTIAEISPFGAFPTHTITIAIVILLARRETSKAIELLQEDRIAAEKLYVA